MLWELARRQHRFQVREFLQQAGGSLLADPAGPWQFVGRVTA